MLNVPDRDKSCQALAGVPLSIYMSVNEGPTCDCGQKPCAIVQQLFDSAPVTSGSGVQRQLTYQVFGSASTPPLRMLQGGLGCGSMSDDDGNYDCDCDSDGHYDRGFRSYCRLRMTLLRCDGDDRGPHVLILQ